MAMRTKDDAIERLDEAIIWLRGYARGSGDDYADSIARELERVRNWVRESGGQEKKSIIRTELSTEEMSHD